MICKQGLLIELVEGCDQKIIHSRGVIEEESFEILLRISAQACQVQLASDRPELDTAPTVISEQVTIRLHETDGLAICGDGGADALPEWRLVAVVDTEQSGSSRPRSEEDRGDDQKYRSNLPNSMLFDYLIY